MSAGCLDHTSAASDGEDGGHTDSWVFMNGIRIGWRWVNFLSYQRYTVYRIKRDTQVQGSSSAGVTEGVLSANASAVRAGNSEEAETSLRG